MTVVVASVVAVLGITTAIGHSVIGERAILRPLFAEVRGGLLALRAVFHMPSVTWAVLGLAVLLARIDGGDRLVSAVAATIFAVAGVGNLAALRRPHPGGLMILAAATLTLVDIAF